MSPDLLLYCLSALTLALIPGPDMLYIISQSTRHGKCLGLAAAAGISAGCFVHMFIVSIGLSSILFKSAFAFTIIKYLGASYLFYLGIATFITKKPSFTTNEQQSNNTITWPKVFFQGFLTNVLNPKVALFFLAFLPQFVLISSSWPVALQMFILGLIFIFLGTIVNFLIAYFFSSAKKWLSTHPFTMRLQQKITGIFLVGLGLKLATFER